MQINLATQLSPFINAQHLLYAPMVPKYHAKQIKYLGMIMDSKLLWKQHVVKKRKQIDLTIKQMNWLIGRKSKLAVETNILIYKAIIIPVWTYGLELWVCVSKFNTSIIQRSQAKILRMILDAPWYVSNATFHAALGISSVQDVIQQRGNKHHNKIKTHENSLLKTLLARDNRRLKRNWPIDLISGTEVSPLDDPHHAI
jgi:hypothetical protein